MLRQVASAAGTLPLRLLAGKTQLPLRHLRQLFGIIECL
jgi:hypothetical protein